MAKAYKELLNEYQAIEKELDSQQENFQSLQASLTESEDHLLKSQHALKEAEKFQKSKSLITIKQVQDAKKETLKAKGAVEDSQRVCDNLETTIQNGSKMIQKAMTNKHRIMQRIWNLYAQQLLDEIEGKVGEKFEQYLIAIVAGNPGLIPHGFPGERGKILHDKAKAGELRRKLQEEIFN